MPAGCVITQANPNKFHINLKINNDTSVDDYDYSIHSLIGNEMSFIEERLSDKELRFILDFQNCNPPNGQKVNDRARC